MVEEKLEKIATEYVVSLFPVFMMIDAFQSEIKKIVDRGCPLVIVIKNKKVDYYVKPSLWQKMHEHLIEKVRKEPDFLQFIFKKIRELSQQQIKDVRILLNKLNQAKNVDLDKYYQDYIKSNTELYGFGLLLPLLDFHNTTFISDELRKILGVNKAKNYFNILTSTTKETYNKKQELDLLKILTVIKKDKELVELFRTKDGVELVKYLKKKNKKIWSLITKHAKKYTWVHYVYEGPSVDEIYFLDFLKDYLIRGLDPAKELAKNEAAKEKLKNEQAQALQKLRLNKYEKTIVTGASDFVFMKAYRREMQTLSYYYIENILREIGRRLHLSLAQVRMLLPEEISLGLKKNVINYNLINQRLKFMVYGYNPTKFCYDSSKAKNLIKQEIKLEEKVGKVNKLEGDTASPGRAKGKVAIINTPDDIPKMQSGNILVSASTNPNLMPAIRQASAIITDEGGLTCHAAIVSRELGIPCVVGTKIASRVLKDGDKVKVDADKGVVKIIK